MKGHATVEFILVFPFFMLMLCGIGEFFLLSYSRISLERVCAQAVRFYASEGKLPTPLKGTSSVKEQPLPSRPSSSPFRARRTISLVRLELSQEIPLRFPLLQIIFNRSNFILQARCAALRVAHE